MKNVLIVEDEAVAGRRLKKITESLGYDVIEICHSTESLNEFLEKNDEPDLYLMDIHLSDRNVFDYLKEVKLENPIIFTTAYDQYAIKAFKQNSIDYLLKPIQKSELKDALERYTSRQKKESHLDINVIKALMNKKEYKNRISIKVGDKYSIIEFDDVTYLYSEDKTTYLHQNSTGRSFPIDPSLSAITEELDPDKFFRINRGCTVNIAYITDVIRYSSSRLKVELDGVDTDECIVARDRVQAFKEWMG